eukprot:2287477-Amphidinium_carterae.1
MGRTQAGLEGCSEELPIAEVQGKIPTLFFPRVAENSSASWFHQVSGETVGDVQILHCTLLPHDSGLLSRAAVQWRFLQTYRDDIEVSESSSLLKFTAPEVVM